MTNKFFIILYSLINNFVPNFSKDISNNLCTLSGGQDSMFLFFLLIHLQKTNTINCHFLYCHHLWQVSNFFSCKQIFKLAFFFEKSLTISFTEHFIKNELNARKWRTFCYYRVLRIEHCTNLLIGHTATDYLETAFFNLIRGSSPQGLSEFETHKKIKNSFFINLFNKNFLSFLAETKINKKRLIKFIKIKKFYWKKKFIKQKKKSDVFLFFFQFNGFYLKKNIFYVKVLKKKIIYLGFSYKYTKPKFSMKLYRPLITYHRNDILKLISYYSIPIIVDSSNNNLMFSRNNIRHNIFTKIRILSKKAFDFKFYQFLNILVQEHYDIHEITKKKIKNSRDLKKFKFKKLSKAEQRRFLFCILKSYTKVSLQYIQIEYVRLFILFQKYRM
uniref:Trna lysidine synthetase n=1 Tax=Prototheca cutis TaxID=575411 RepID=A0A2Z6BET0_9CHLO|nr:trna lysidine synthetase [Prototheca cutis]BBD20233.1 trna lysidine synthetase [Prototheca cutis]